MILLRKNDYDWLRAAAMKQDGFLQGFAWNACAPAYERLRGFGLVTRVDVPLSPDRDGSPRVLSRAVATDQGQKEIARRAKFNLNRLSGLEGPSA